MKRVVILGRGASGKSTLARKLGEITQLPVFELDKIFWQPGLVATTPGQWARTQQVLLERNQWIMDGDLGPYDVVDVRLRSADTVIFLDFSLPRCAWQAVRRAPERADFWRWLLTYRRRYRPLLMRSIATHAGSAQLYILRDKGEVERLVASIARKSRPV